MNFEEQVEVLSQRYMTKKENIRPVLEQARMKPYIRVHKDFNHAAYRLTERYLRFHLYMSVGRND